MYECPVCGYLFMYCTDMKRDCFELVSELWHCHNCGAKFEVKYKTIDIQLLPSKLKINPISEYL